MADEAIRRGGNAACIVNAANEVAVAAFLRERIGFYDIYDIIASTLDKATRIEHPDYADYVASNAEARDIALRQIKNEK